MILNPGENFSVVRQLQDPNDVGTYYVRAVIRNALTDAIIATINLTDRGVQRFSKTWQVPADAVGLGFYISIETRVYTDAAYTTLSDSYGQEINTYLVDNRFRSLNAGGGGSDIDYKKIKAIFVDVLKGFDFGFPSLSDIKKMLTGSFKFSELLETARRIEKKTDAVGECVDTIEAKEFPEAAAVDLNPVLDAIAQLPRFEPTDLSQVLVGLQGVLSAIEEDGKLSELRKGVEAFIQVLESGELRKAAESVPAIGADIAKIEGGLKDFLLIMAKQGVKKEEPAGPDYHSQAHEMLGIGLPAKTK